MAKRKPGRPKSKKSATAKKPKKVKLNSTQKELSKLYATVHHLSEALEAQKRALDVFEKFEALIFAQHERLKIVEEKIMTMQEEKSKE